MGLRVWNACIGAYRALVSAVHTGDPRMICVQGNTFRRTLICGSVFASGRKKIE